MKTNLRIRNYGGKNAAESCSFILPKMINILTTNSLNDKWFYAKLYKSIVIKIDLTKNSN